MFTEETDLTLSQEFYLNSRRSTNLRFIMAEFKAHLEVNSILDSTENIHSTLFHEIDTSSYEYFISNALSHCIRCGREYDILHPRVGELCENCDKALDSEFTQQSNGSELLRQVNTNVDEIFKL